MNAFDLTGKTMVITGGTNGIGKGLTEYFAKQGVIVAAVGSRAQSAQEMKKYIKEKGMDINTYHADIRNVSEIQPLFDKIAADLGHIDILINCAGMGKPIPAVGVTAEDWDEMMDVNVRGTFFCSQAAARHMLPRKYGRIINITSQLSVVANENEAVYCASKGAINNLTRALSYEWSRDGVIVSAVAPTFTYTPGTAERLDDPTFRDNVLARIPRGRLGTIEDIGAAVQYLACDQADMASGVVLFIDGGWTIV
ncbi:MAG: SDR family oxidoreductase [Clostridiales bacterium]|nr:SDR family oxidoreductase [Clostridiales bacterium]